MMMTEPYITDGDNSVPQNMMPIAHLLRHLYFNFVILQSDYEALKNDTLR